MSTSIAGKLQILQELLRMPVEDEHGNVLSYVSIITVEEARKLLEAMMNETPHTHGILNAK